MHQRSVIVLLAATAALAGGISIIDSRLPVSSRVIRLEPESAKPGHVVTAYGQCLGTAYVDDLSLSDGSGHALVTILEQTETAIRFRVPSMLTPGRYTLTIHVSRYRKSIEQAVTLTVE
jgi:hypothetical protein